MAGRYFGKTPKEWDELPWWVQRVWLEGLEVDGIVTLNDDVRPDAIDPMADLSSAGFANLGITVRR